VNHLNVPQSALIGIETKGEVGVITLTRPEKRNAMNEEMIAIIGQVFASPPPGWKAVLIEAQGDHFSAGLDLSEHRNRTPEQVMDISSHWHKATQAIADSRIPVVCALKGYVIGAGLELASSAHVRFADPEARFCLPEGRRGIFCRWRRICPGGTPDRDKPPDELMLSGREVECGEAVSMGLCQRVSAPGRSSEDAFDFAKEVATNAPLSNRMILLALAQIAEMPPTGGLFTESLAAALTQTSPEALERMNAFFNQPRTKS
jgi:enoyl-CoA hydratase/carnithine racemase